MNMDHYMQARFAFIEHCIDSVFGTFISAYKTKPSKDDIINHLNWRLEIWDMLYKETFGNLAATPNGKAPDAAPSNVHPIDNAQSDRVRSVAMALGGSGVDQGTPLANAIQQAEQLLGRKLTDAEKATYAAGATQQAAVVQPRPAVLTPPQGSE